MPRIWTLAALLVLGAGAVLARSSLDGVVRDAETLETLAGASIRIAGGLSGVLADANGAFSLAVASFPATLQVSHVGYETRDVRLLSPPGDRLDLLLLPVAYEMEETLVQFEDPALRIMREVIRRKRTWHPPLKTLSFTAYTRQTLYSDNEIAGVREEESRVYRDAERGSREIVRAKRHSANVPDSLQYFAAGAYLVDLCADEVELLGQRVVGPTHPQAFAHYAFDLGEQRFVAGDTLYHISVMPRDGLRTAFAGHLVVQGGTYAVVEAGLTPVPPILPVGLAVEAGIRFRFEQRLAPLPSGIWLSVALDYEIEARVGTSALDETISRLRGGRTPRARLKGVCRLRDHRFGGGLPEFVYLVDTPLEADALATVRDSLARAVPLSPRETGAYARLARARKSLGESPVAGLYALHPGLPRPVESPRASAPDPFAAETLVDSETLEIAVELGLGVPVPELPDGDLVPTFAPEVWYNRVEGAHLGYRMSVHPGRSLGLFARGGYTVGAERTFLGAGAALSRGKRRSLTLTYEEGVRTTYASDNYSLAYNSFPALLGIGDHFDYFWRRGWRIDAEWRFPEEKLQLNLGLSLADHASLRKATDFDLICDFQPESGRFYDRFCADRDHDFRDNPAVEAGRLRSVDVRLNYGGPYVPRGRRAHRRAEVWLEHSSPLMASDFDFTGLQFTLDWHLPTLMRRRADPNALDLRFVGGTASGSLPPQRYGALDVGLWRYTPFGAFRSRQDRPYVGEKHAALFWEHSFGGTLFELLGMRGLAATGTGLILHGASGRVWNRPETCSACTDLPTQSHHEVGVSLVLANRFRIDAARRLDRRGWWIGFSLARSGR